MLINLSSYNFDSMPENFKKKFFELYQTVVDIKPPHIAEEIKKRDINRLTRNYLKKIQRLIASQNHKNNAVLLGSNLIFDYYMIGKLKGKKIKTLTFVDVRTTGELLGVLDVYEFN
jgi:predicted esterase YcpF (UPF0227 family)